MKSATNGKLVLVTAPDLTVARRLAKAALEARLIACANLIPKIESHYRWQGRIQRDTEILLILKTTARRLARLEKLILERHPYDTPEFLVLPLSGGNERYSNGWPERRKFYVRTENWLAARFRREHSGLMRRAQRVVTV